LHKQREENAKIERIVDQRVKEMWLEETAKKAIDAPPSDGEADEEGSSYYDEEEDQEETAE